MSIVGRDPLPSLERYPSHQLPRREIQIATLDGKNAMRNREVAQTLGLSEQDVKNRLRRIFNKLGIWSRAELVLRLSNRDLASSRKD
jgi:DNA-binding NarL/FixJ family response regulator